MIVAHVVCPDGDVLANWRAELADKRGWQVVRVNHDEIPFQAGDLVSFVAAGTKADRDRVAVDPPMTTGTGIRRDDESITVADDEGRETRVPLENVVMVVRDDDSGDSQRPADELPAPSCG